MAEGGKVSDKLQTVEASARGWKVLARLTGYHTERLIDEGHIVRKPDGGLEFTQEAVDELFRRLEESTEKIIAVEEAAQAMRKE